MGPFSRDYSICTSTHYRYLFKARDFALQLIFFNTSNHGAGDGFALSFPIYGLLPTAKETRLQNTMNQSAIAAVLYVIAIGRVFIVTHNKTVSLVKHKMMANKSVYLHCFTDIFTSRPGVSV